MINETKCCNKCKQIFPLTNFVKDTSKKDGLANKCKDCKSLYAKAYWQKIQGDEKLKRKEQKRSRAAGKKWRSGGKLKEYRESSPKRWFSLRIGTIKKSAKDRGLSFNITADHLLMLWNDQHQRCAISGLLMVCKFHSLFAVSVDRVDSDIGYEPNNIQLVCKAINLAKSDHTTCEVVEFLTALKNEDRKLPSY